MPIWFERKFEFSFPVELLPNLCARLRGTPARLKGVVRSVARDVLVITPSEKWTAQENTGHLLYLEPLWMARIDDSLEAEKRACDTEFQRALEVSQKVGGTSK